MNLESYDAVVYDLDGTLISLAVDWNRVAADAAAVFEAAGVDVSGADLWSMLDLAADHGLSADVEAVIADHECRGAERSERLALSERLADHAGPVGVCSLNAERAVRLALDAHGIADHVDAVLGRDSVATRKPDPEPLLATLDAIGGDPDAAVFVGDSERDAVTAERAGVAFRYVDGAP